MSLKLKAFQGIKWNSIASIIVIGLGFIQLYILVRYLTKSDFGTMALGLMIVTYIGSFADIGMNNAIIHKKEISKTQRSTMYWMIFAFSIFLFATLYSLSNPIAEYFDNITLSKAIKILSTVILIQAVGGIFNSYLQKKLDFKFLSIVNILSSIINFAVSVSLAIKGFGLMSLIWAYLAISLFKNMSYLIKGWKANSIDFSLDLSSVKFFLNYGKYEIANQAFSNISRKIDTLIIGKFIGVESLGVYDVLKNLLRKPQSLIVPVFTDISFPLISNVQDSKVKTTTVFIKQMQMVYFLIAPIYAFLLFNTYDIILLYLGESWTEYKSVFVFLAAFFLVRISGTPVGGLLRALGKIKQLFWWNTILGIILILALLLLGKSQLLHIVYVLFGFQLIMIIPNYLININGNLSASHFEFFGSFLVPITIALLSFGLISNLFNFDLGLIERLLVQIILGSLLYLIVSLKFQRDIFKSIYSLIRQKTSRH